MRFKAKNWDFICTKCKNEGMYDMIIYNPHTREYFNERVSEEYIRGVDSYGNPYSAAEISRGTFDIIARKLFMDSGSAIGFFDDYGDGEDFQEPTETTPRETVLQRIRGELTMDEFKKMYRGSIEQGDYYDFDAFMDVIHRFKMNEITKDDYLDWVILVSWALNFNNFEENSKKELLYNNLSDCFDGHAFDDLDEEKERECNEMIAYLKHYNHKLKNIGKHYPDTFLSEGKIAVYISFDFCNHYNVHYKICVADKKNRIFRVTTVANPFYMENVNYTFTDSDDFVELVSEYYDYYHDKDMDIHKYITELPYLDADGNALNEY